MNQTIHQWGGLTCRAIDRLPEGQAPKLTVVLCHGYGAPGTDLVDIGRELVSAVPAIAHNVRFLFPEAPLSLELYGLLGGRAWWHLDMARITESIARGELRDLRNDLPEGLEESREMLMQLLVEYQQAAGVSTSQIVMGGFSQGAMLATDVALRLEESPAALIAYSGTLLCESEWRPLAEKRTDMPVLQSHGRQDPILPFQAALWLRDFFVDVGAPIEFIEFDGVHSISMSALRRTAELLQSLVE